MEQQLESSDSKPALKKMGSQNEMSDQPKESETDQTIILSKQDLAVILEDNVSLLKA